MHPSINLLEVRTFCVSNAFLCSVHHPQVIPFSSFCNHGRPTCHYGVNFLVLVFSYSLGGAVLLSLFAFDTGRYLHILTLRYLNSVNGSSLTMLSWWSIAIQTVIYFFNEKSPKTDLNSTTKKEHTSKVETQFY